MKKIKKASIFFIASCMMLFYTSIISFAAEGTLDFSDSTGSIGAEITVTAKMTAGGEAIGDGSVTVTYDPAMLEFVSGTGVTAGEGGTVTMFAAGSGSEVELNFSLVFKALAEGTTTIEVSDYTAYLFSDESLNLQTGHATVTIGGNAAAGAGTGTGSGSGIQMQGVAYSVYENFSNALIPDGFSRTTMALGGVEHNCIVQDVSGRHVFFLVAGDGEPVMALYDDASDSFAAAEQVFIRDDFFLLVLDKGDGKILPDNFQQTTLDLNGRIFPTWNNTSAPDFYLVYALSSSGNEGFYLYDKIEGTYQRYEVVKPDKETQPKAADQWYDKILDLIKDHLLVALIAIWAVILLLLIIIIVMSIKLHRRNNELEELYDNHYDEYDDEDDEDEYDEDDEYDDDEYDDEYDDDDRYDDDDEYDDEYDDDDDDDDDKDDYNIDFIDL